MMFLFIFVISPIFSQDNSKEYVALRLAIEKNMCSSSYKVSGYKAEYKGEDFLTANVYIIPLNIEVIKSVIEYKAKLESLSDIQRELLITRNRKIFIDGGEAVFALLVKCNDHFDYDDLARYIDFEKKTFIKDEYNQTFYLTRFTRIFQYNLSPDWNKGFLYFKNFRDNNLNSYSLHLAPLELTSVPNTSTGIFYDNFSFEDNEVGFLRTYP